MKNLVSMLLVTGLLFSVVAESATVSTVFSGVTNGGVTVHPVTGDIYASEWGATNAPKNPTHRIFRITPEGNATLFAGGFANADGNDFDSKGNLFQVNYGDGRLSKITPGGSVSSFSGFSSPTDVVIDAEDTMYVAEWGNNKISKVLPDGTSSTIVRSAVLDEPSGITIDAMGDVYVASWGSGRIFKLEKDGSINFFSNVSGNTPHLTSANGKLYVTSASTQTVWEIPLEGETHKATLLAGRSNIAGNADGPALEATFDQPNAIAVNRDGTTLYVTDLNGVRQITLD